MRKKVSCSHLGKAFEQQTKAIEDQARKRVKALKPAEQQQKPKSTEDIFETNIMLKNTWKVGHKVLHIMGYNLRRRQRLVLFHQILAIGGTIF